jgi:hypothetical protein
MARKTSKLKLDMMSVTVLLVMVVFGGIVGYYLGQGSALANTVTLCQQPMQQAK